VALPPAPPAELEVVLLPATPVEVEVVLLVVDLPHIVAAGAMLASSDTGRRSPPPRC
jgi:hypothetical protein